MKKKMVALLLAVMVTSTSLMQVPVVAHAEENQTEVSLMEEEQSEAAEEGTEQPEVEEPTLEESEEPEVTTPEETEEVETTETPEAAEEMIAPQATEEEVEVQAEKTKISYRTHVQTYGWQNFVSNGEMSGTTGQSKRLEGIEIKLENPEYDGGIRYKTHVQTYGWQKWMENGAMAGTTGQSKRLEAIQMELTGEMAEHYDVYYRVHSQTFGWMGWAKNGQLAGTAGYSKRLEGIEICLVEKDGAAPGSTDNRYRHPLIEYRTHVQTYGWQGYVQDGNTSGTTGQSKRLEGINIKLNNQEYNGGVRYKTHVQTYGWQDWKSDGAMAGTEGQSKRLEAIQIELTGEMANHYDIYYRVHCQTYGWMGWAKNGELAGTAGYSKRLEGIEIKLVSKGAAAPGKTDGAYTEPHTHTWVEITKEEPVVEEMVACEVCNDCNLNMTKKWLDEKGDYLKWYNSGNTYEGKNTLVAYLRSTAEEREDSTFDHMETHRYTGKGSWRTEYVTLDTGLTKTVVTGYKCSGCGATK